MPILMTNSSIILQPDILEFKYEEGHPLTLSPEILKAWRTDGVVIARYQIF